LIEVLDEARIVVGNATALRTGIFAGGEALERSGSGDGGDHQEGRDDDPKRQHLCVETWWGTVVSVERVWSVWFEVSEEREEKRVGYCRSKASAFYLDCIGTEGPTEGEGDCTQRHCLFYGEREASLLRSLTLMRKVTLK
jgi:hypothetical protein